MSKRILSLILAVVMVALAIPAAILPTFAAEAEAEGFVTTFSDADIVAEYNANKAKYTTGTVIEFPQGWAIGSMSAAAWDTGYRVTNTAQNNGEYFNDGSNGWMEGSKGGGFYFASGRLVAGVTYPSMPNESNTTPYDPADEVAKANDTNGDGYVNSNDRLFKSVDTNVLIRYTAPYFGTVTIDVTKLNFFNDWNATFCILVNGKPVGQFDTEGFDYATGAGWFDPTVVDSADEIDTIKLDVKKGDKIDFVFRATPVDFTNESRFRYDSVKRLAEDWGFSVEYEAGYAPVADMNAWDNFATADVVINNTRGTYFFSWFNGTTEITSGSIPDTAVCKINPYLIKNGIVAETDTVAAAFAKWVAYMKETTKITYNSNWSMGSIASGEYLPILYHGFLSDRSAFHLDGSAGSYSFGGHDNQYWLPEAGVDKQFDKMLSLITALISPETVVSTIALNPSAAMSRATAANKITPSTSTGYGHSGKLNAGRTDPFWARPAGNAGAVNVAYTWTAPAAGYAKFEIGNLQYQDTAKMDFAVMLNGSVVLGWQQFDLTADPTAAVNKFIADLEIGVQKGDEVSLVIARVNGAAARVNLTAKATLDTSRIPPVFKTEDKWMAEKGSASTSINSTQGMYFFRWYNADGSRITSGSVKAGYLQVNQYLFDNNIVSENDTLKQAFDKWVAYMKDTWCINYTGNWTMGNMTANGVYEPIKYAGFASNQSFMNVDANGNLSYWDNQFWVTETVLDAQMADAYAKVINFVDPAAKAGNIKVAYKAGMDAKVVASTSSVHTVGGNGAAITNGGASAFWTRPLANAGTDKQGAYTWTATEAGVATISAAGVSFAEFTGGMPVAIMLNGQIIKDWTTFNTQSATALADFNELINMEIPVNVGDQVSIVTARLNGSATRFYANFQVSMDLSRVPVSYVRDGVILQTFAAKVGEPIPALTAATGFGLMGYKVNGEFVKALPTVVEGALVIEDYMVKSSASITITGKYAINVFVAADADALGAGVIVDGKMIDGVKQADGSYKVVLANVNANALQKTSITYVAYQVYADGYRINVNQNTVKTMDLLKAYSTGNFDATTKALASSVLDFAEALRAYLTQGDLDANIKDNLKGSYTISGNYLSGKNDIYLGTLKQISTGEVAKYGYPFKDAVFVPDSSVTAADKVVIGYADGVNPQSKEYKFAIKSATLNMEERIGFAFKVIANGKNEVSDLRAGGVYKVMMTDGKSVAYFDEFLYSGTDKYSKCIAIDGIPASRYMQDYVFTIVEQQADGSFAPVSAPMTYSVKAYAVSTYTFGAASSPSYLAQALFRLGVVAEEYVAAHPVA